MPILDSEHVLLPRANSESEQRGLLVADVEFEGEPFRALNAHLSVTADDRRLQVTTP